MYTIYNQCPIFQNETITLRQIREEDAAGLLNCYADEQALPFFNTDNCHGTDFHCTTLEQMKQAIAGWNWCYGMKEFVRLTICLNATQEIIGTVEMFNRGAAPFYGVHGVLRIDVMSRYERADVLQAILQLADEHFYQAFGMEWIVTKAKSFALERRKALTALGYIPMTEFALSDYYGRPEEK